MPCTPLSSSQALCKLSGGNAEATSLAQASHGRGTLMQQLRPGLRTHQKSPRWSFRVKSGWPRPLQLPHSPPRHGGKPRPNTAPMSPSTGLLRIPSCRHMAASFTNLVTRRIWMSSSVQLPGKKESARAVQLTQRLDGGVRETSRGGGQGSGLEGGEELIGKVPSLVRLRAAKFCAVTPGRHAGMGKESIWLDGNCSRRYFSIRLCSSSAP